jgi:hypothetical protein
MIDEHNKMDDKKEDAPEPRSSETDDVTSPGTTAEICSENRDNTRYPCEGSVEFLTEGSEVRTFAELKDLSFGGCYLEMTATSAPGCRVHLVIEARNIRFRVRGVVRTSYPCLGMGIAFGEISSTDKQYLQELLLSLSAQTKATPSLVTLPTRLCAEKAVKALAELFETRSFISRDEFLRAIERCAE